MHVFINNNFILGIRDNDVRRRNMAKSMHSCTLAACAVVHCSAAVLKKKLRKCKQWTKEEHSSAFCACSQFEDQLHCNTTYKWNKCVLQCIYCMWPIWRNILRAMSTIFGIRWISSLLHLKLKSKQNYIGQMENYRIHSGWMCTYWINILLWKLWINSSAANGVRN